MCTADELSGFIAMGSFTCDDEVTVNDIHMSQGLN